jgi:NAD(P)-dependent dehydrogenase (short-subunit alcohol dehydrogenase family)
MTRPSAIVTGGSRGIGLAIAQRLADDGYDVLTAQRSPPPDPRLGHLEIDLSDLDAVTQAFGEVAKQQVVEVLVNNAGVSGVAMVGQLDMEDFARFATVNLGAVIAGTNAVVPAMIDRRFGRIMNIGSRASLGKEGRSFYAATKAGLAGLTRTWALELAPHGITVNTIAPGPTATALFNETNPEGSAARQAIMSSVPVGRLAEPADIAAATAFFVRSEAGFVTGQTLSVCGGITVGIATQ